MVVTKGKMRERLTEACIPFEYWNYSFKQFAKQVKKLGKPFIKYYENLDKVKKSGVCMLLGGSNGTGKTSLAVEIGKKALTEGFTVRMISLSELIELYTASWRSDDSKRLLNDVRECDFLILDDLGKEIKLGENQENMVRLYFENLMRYRTTWCKPMIMTTNATKEETEEFFGTSAISIIQGKFIKFILSGSDYRVRKGKELEQEIEGWD